MKEISELYFPDELGYSAEHEWVRDDGDLTVIGITDYAQDQLGDVVFIELPNVGDTFKQNSVFGTIESVKAVSELFTPIDCEIVEVNKELENNPSLVNQSPYDDAWMLKVNSISDAEECELLTKDGYINTIKG